MLLETIKTFVTRHKDRRHISEKSTAQRPQNFLQLTGSSAPEAQLPLPALPLSSITTFGAQANEAPQAQEPPGQMQNASSSNGFFPNSQDFVANFNHSTLVSNVFKSGGGAVMQLLVAKRISGAEVDSSARYPPPRCHPDTRQELREQITDWIVDPGRRSRMLYVLGPAGVGKSALAQTIAEDRQEAGFLGATCFLSRPNRRNDPDGVIPTLVHQLAVKHPGYKHIITQKLADDPTILEKSRKVQFKQLIVDPFRTIMTEHASTVRVPLLIIIDGLDECEGEEAQCEFVELISDHARSVSQFPLLWMICSRPEWHLRYLMNQPDFQVTCTRVEISVDDDEAQRDVLVYLRAEFAKIRERHRDFLDDDWPQEMHLRRIAAAASGLFAFASTMVRFIGDTNTGDPSENLQNCIGMLESSNVLGSLNPYYALDLLYRQILSTIPSVVRPTTMRILGALLLYKPSPSPFLSSRIGPPPIESPVSSINSFVAQPVSRIISPEPHPSVPSRTPTSPSSFSSLSALSESPPTMLKVVSDPTFLVASAMVQATFLRVTKSSFYHALKQLYSVLRIPSASDASMDSILFYHASFGDFLQDQKRSAEFCIDMATVHHDVAINALRWHTDSVEKQLNDISWVSSQEERETCLELLQFHSSYVVWKACVDADRYQVLHLLQELQSFDFSALSDYSPQAQDFLDFLMWLYSLRDHPLARKLIHVPEKCVRCADVESGIYHSSKPISTILTGFGLKTPNSLYTDVHLYVGDGSRQCHIQIIPGSPFLTIRAPVALTSG